MAELNVQQIQEQLQKLKAEHGEQVYLQARRDLALSLVLQPKGEEFIANAFPDLDVEELKAEAQKRLEALPEGPATPEQVMLRLLQAQVPSIKTQGHFNLFTAAFDAMRTCLDGYFSGDMEKAKRAREALNKTLDTAADLKGILEKLEEIPDDVRSKQATEFLEPPKEFHEYDTQRQLLVELGAIQTKLELTQWYERTKPLRDRVTSQKLRNELMDKIRARRIELDAKETN